jgi:hypothetical protein
MIVVSDNRGFRIQVDAIAVDGRYNAEVRIRRLFSQDKPHIDTVTCLKITPDLAEHSGEIWARRLVALGQLIDVPAPFVARAVMPTSR